MNNSEVTRLLDEIDAQYWGAYQGLSGLSSGASQHRVIAAKISGMESSRQALIDIVGDEEAMRMVVAKLNEREQ